MGQKGIAGTAINEITAQAGTALFDEKVTGEVFCSPERARVVGVLPPCRANVKKIPGSYLIEESVWGFNSAIYHGNCDLLGIALDTFPELLPRRRIQYPVYSMVRKTGERINLASIHHSDQSVACKTRRKNCIRKRFQLPHALFDRPDASGAATSMRHTQRSRKGM